MRAVEWVVAGFRGGVCLMATRSKVADDLFMRRAKDRGLEVRVVPWAEALRAASPGFRTSLRHLMRAMREDDDA